MKLTKMLRVMLTRRTLILQSKFVHPSPSRGTSILLIYEVSMTVDEYYFDGDLASDGLDLPGESVVDTDSSIFDFDFDDDEDEAELGEKGDEPMMVDESAGAVSDDQSVGEHDGGSKPPKKATAPQVCSSILLLAFLYSPCLANAFADYQSTRNQCVALYVQPSMLE